MEPQNLKCKECGYENEPERVYCHNCGIKLDRTLVPQVDHDKIRKMKEKKKKREVRREETRKFVAAGVKTLIYSLLFAGLIRAVLPPDDIPPLKERVEVDPPSIMFELDDAVNSPTPAKLTYTEDQVNDYLLTSIRAKKDATMAKYSRFVRVYCNLEKGYATVWTQQSVFNYSFFASAKYSVVISKKGTLKVRNAGGSFGRLHIPASVMQYADIIFQKVWNTLEREGQLVTQLRSIGLYDKKVVFISKGQS